MPTNTLDSSAFSPDVREFLSLLHKHNVRYMVVGGEAVIYYGHIRLTGDIDFYYDLSEDNARALFAALQEFWQGAVPGVQAADELTELGVIVQFGRPPNRIDLINRVDGLEFGTAFLNRKIVPLHLAGGEVPISYISLDDLVKNKETAGRPKDVTDLGFLRNLPRR